jgi:hypothetical protein
MDVSALCEEITADSYGEGSHEYRLKVCNNFEGILFRGFFNNTFSIETTVSVEKLYFHFLNLIPVKKRDGTYCSSK